MASGLLLSTQKKRRRFVLAAAFTQKNKEAAPPSAASNSRRPMVTVIRPSRARCVTGTIPRHERAVPNSAAPGADGTHTRHRLRRSAARPTSGLILGDLCSAAPLHFLADLRDDVDARGFL